MDERPFKQVEFADENFVKLPSVKVATAGEQLSLNMVEEISIQTTGPGLFEFTEQAGALVRGCGDGLLRGGSGRGGA